MAVPAIKPTGRERGFDANEIIVSKTDLKGRITYANDVFLRMSSYAEVDLIGKPHNIIRHPDMPACVFKLLWDTISAGREIFAYVLNLARDGDAYWVHAHVTPTYDGAGALIGYHSNRRTPTPEAVAKIKPIYAALLAEERKHENKKEGIAAGQWKLNAMLADAGQTYDELVWSL